jgi:squalene-hopene/tetraprenyl-beta-curcumene cyclase
VLAAGGIAGLARPVAAADVDRDKVIAKAIAYLRSSQAEDGTWSANLSPGVTGVVVTALLRNGVPADDPTVAKGLRYIESLVNPEAGHIAGANPRVQLQNYVTSVNVMALAAAGRDDKYKPVVKNAVEFLKRLQWDESEGKTPKDDYYGGAGYDSKSRPDLSNTQYFLDALQAAGVPPDDPAMKKAMVFVSRCQNLKSEHNDQPWADKINDGSFIYTAAEGGESKASTDGSRPGYGSMTYAGVKSMIYCGVSPDDPRFVKAWEWIRNHYQLDDNPGMPAAQADRGLYYYYHTLAKTLDAMKVGELKDAQGVAHDWRADLTAELAKRQKANGSWRNNVAGWMEADPNLVTAYALLALSYTKK